jgi:Fe2+ transport system protein FeoA
MTLLEATEGQLLLVTAVADDEIAYQAIRFGIAEGSEIRLTKKLPGGPVIISRNHLEIALGSELASAIEVTDLSRVERP